VPTKLLHGLAALAVALIAACSGGSSGAPTVSRPTTTERAAPAPAPAPATASRDLPSARQVRAALEALPAGWSSLAFPRRHRSSAVYVWTGRELVFWGGDLNDAAYHADGIAYDPVSNRWRGLLDAPIQGRSQAGAVWTGREVVVWGGINGSGPAADGAAFDPSTGSWRVLAESPLTPRIPLAVVWTGTEMLVWGNRTWNAVALDGAAYDPAHDTWRPLPDSPLTMNRGTAVWTGSEMIVLGATVGERDVVEMDSHARAMAFDPRAGTWRVLPPYPLAAAASTLVWTGHRILAWDYEFRAAAYDPRRDAWATIPGPPLAFFECGPQGELFRGRVLAFSCGLAALRDSKGWRRLARPGRNIWSPAVVAGPVVFVVGTTLWAYSLD
jgi:hypothetical protein